MTMENRNYFSLHCIQMETQLVHANIDILAEVLQALAKTELQGHKEVRTSYRNQGTDRQTHKG